MGPVLVLGPVRGVAESFGAAREFTGVGLFARVGADVADRVVPGQEFLEADGASPAVRKDVAFL